MTYTDEQIAGAMSALEKFRGDADGEVGAALTVVGLSSERAAREVALRDHMIRVAHHTVHRCDS